MLCVCESRMHCHMLCVCESCMSCHILQHLALEKNDPQRFTSANEAFNKNKNRYVNILPCKSRPSASCLGCRQQSCVVITVTPPFPVEANRVPLETIRGVEGADYINASFIDVSRGLHNYPQQHSLALTLPFCLPLPPSHCVQSYQIQRAFIATQAPLENTIEHFWRMIWQYKSPIIVMLTQLTEQGVVSPP